jgi:hypothetical protein
MDNNKNELKIISFPFLEYKKRVKDHMYYSYWGFLFFIIFMYQSYSISKFFFIIVILFFLYFLFINFNEAKIYIIEIAIQEKIIRIKYYKKDNGPEELYFDKDTFHFEFIPSIMGGFEGSHIYIYDNNKSITQYVVGNWTPELMKVVYKKFWDLKKGRPVTPI